jgi:hypothetical protein
MSRGSSLKLFRRFALCAGASLASLALIAPAAEAGPLVASAPDCDGQMLSQPFTPWADVMHYTPAADGGFEHGAAGWTLKDGGQVVDGNESYYVTSASDSHSLRLPAGASATSPTICVGIEHPTVRMFVRRAAGLTGTASVEVLFEDAFGDVHAQAIGSVAGVGSWQPSLPLPIVANLLPLLPGDHTPVAFRVTGLTGDVRIDDFYVDPYRRS